MRISQDGLVARPRKPLRTIDPVTKEPIPYVPRHIRYSAETVERVRRDYERCLYETVAELAKANNVTPTAIYYWARKYNWEKVKELKTKELNDAMRDKVIRETIAQPSEEEAVVVQRRFRSIWNSLLSEVLAGIKDARDAGMRLNHRVLVSYSKVVWQAQQGHGMSFLAAAEATKKDTSQPLPPVSDLNLAQLTEAEIVREIELIDASLIRKLSGNDAESVSEESATARASQATGA